MQDLPIGTVTFLVTDVEGSTRLLERLGARYRDIQHRHDAILRAAIAEGDGREVGTQGDSFFAVFRTPAGAVRAAAQAQRQFAATPWPHGAAMQIRMGLHTGKGILGGDNYLGLDVNRTARIAAAARRSGPPVGRHSGAGRTEPAPRNAAARPWPAPAEGPDAAGTAAHAPD